MKSRIASFVFVLTTFLSPAFAQVYLILATPPAAGQRGDYASSLARVNSDGSVQSVLEIVPLGARPEASGAAKALISHDSRKAVFIGEFFNSRIFVFDFDQVSVVKTCPLPEVNGFHPFQEWLVQPLGAELMLGLDYSTLDSIPVETILGMNLDPTVPCDRSFAPLDRENYKYVRRHGAGIGEIGGEDPLLLPIATDGSMKQIWFNHQQTYLPYRIPPDLISGIKNPEARILVDNAQIFAAIVFQLNGPGSVNGLSRTLVFRKSDQTWHRLPDAIPPPSIRGFGRFLALAETRARVADYKETPGASEWKKDGETKNGPGVLSRMIALKHVYTGILRLFDVSNGKTYSINTDQGDSEILLVENDVVYYRVYNRLYSAPIAGDSLGPAQLLATSDLIPDAHWAFIKH